MFTFRRVGKPFRSGPTRFRRLEIRRDQAHQLGSMTNELLRQGALLPDDDQDRTALLQQAISAEPNRYELAPAYLGWRDENRVIMFPDKPRGAVNPDIKMVTPQWFAAL